MWCKRDFCAAAQRNMNRSGAAKFHPVGTGGLHAAPPFSVRKHKVVNEIRGGIAPSLWDHIAELVLG